ncbi:MAG: hypothetical protein ACKVP0_10135 [Pirellulaceae bacterium]
MRPFISLITLAACLLHFGLGCCAHHAHAADSAKCEVLFSTVDHTGHGHSHGHEHSVPDSETPHPGGSHNDCHDSHCNLLATGKTTIILDTLIAALPMAVLDTVVGQVSSSSLTWIRDTGDHLRLPVRLHLFNQVLLI